MNRRTDARNQEFRAYEQVDKDQDYRLSEGGEDRFDDQFEIAVCDLSLWSGNAADQDRFATEFGQALEEIGFAILIGHGVDAALYDAAEQWVEDFFTQIPLERRMDYRARRHGSVNQGYFPVNETTNIHPDQVEGWVFCRRAFELDDRTIDPHQFWPEASFEPRFRRLAEAHEPLIKPIMQAMLHYLGCDRHLYDKRLERTNFGLRLNYYPPDPPGVGGRMLGHEDVDLFTILPAPRNPGLQVLNRRNMRWIRLAAPPGSIIINTGDYMQRISNDRLPSTTHRVARPERGDRRARVSFPMAVYTWEDDLLEVLPGLDGPRYPPIRAEDFHTAITSKYYGDDYATADA